MVTILHVVIIYQKPNARARELVLCEALKIDVASLAASANKSVYDAASSHDDTA